jgi:ribosomal protein S18 acetylase RimI-like enzyme
MKLSKIYNELLKESIKYKNISDSDEYWDRVKIIITNKKNIEIGYAILDMWISDSEWSYMDDDDEGKFSDDEFDKHFPHGGGAKLEHLEINPEYRNGGYGKQLMDAVVSYVKKRNTNTLYLIAAPVGFEPRISLDALTNFYKKYGFNIVKDFGNARDMVTQLGEELTYRHTNTTGPEDDEYDVGMIKEDDGGEYSHLRFNDGRLNKHGANIIYYDDNPIVDFGIGQIGNINVSGNNIDNAIFLQGGYNSSEQNKGYGSLGLKFIFNKLQKIQNIIVQCYDSVCPFWKKMGGKIIQSRDIANSGKPLHTMIINRNDIPL